MIYRHAESTSPMGLAPSAGLAAIGFLAFAKACETRLADDIRAQTASDLSERFDLARKVLRGHIRIDQDSPASPHIWLPPSAPRMRKHSTSV